MIKFKGTKKGVHPVGTPLVASTGKLLGRGEGGRTPTATGHSTSNTACLPIPPLPDNGLVGIQKGHKLLTKSWPSSST